MDVRDFFAPLAIARLGVAISGGVDSTALLAMLAEWRERPFALVALHVNHQLRGDESERDEQFVRGLCERLDVDLRVLRAGVDAERVRETGVENAAREARRAALLQTARESNLDAIATAHHLNDQAETVLLAMLRGGGARRLAGIRPIDMPWVRPLLDVSRAEIEQFLADRELSPRIDSTNLESRFLRNRIRNELLPSMKALQPRVIQHLAEIATQLREGEQELVRLEAAWRDRWIEESRSDRLTLYRAGMNESPFLFRRVLVDEAFSRDATARELNAGDLRRISMQLEGSSSAIQITRNLRLSGEGDLLVLERITPPGDRVEIDHPVQPGDEVEWQALSQRITIRAVEGTYPGAFSLPEGAGELRLRTRRPGDRWHPPGSTSTKKLKDVLIERRIDRKLRDRLPILTWNERIVWVAELGVSKEFLPREGCSRIFAIEVVESI